MPNRWIIAEQMDNSKGPVGRVGGDRLVQNARNHYVIFRGGVAHAIVKGATRPTFYFSQEEAEKEKRWIGKDAKVLFLKEGEYYHFEKDPNYLQHGGTTGRSDGARH